jgi:hypothetical protein
MEDPMQRHPLADYHDAFAEALAELHSQFPGKARSPRYVPRFNRSRRRALIQASQGNIANAMRLSIGVPKDTIWAMALLIYPEIHVNQLIY